MSKTVHVSNISHLIEKSHIEDLFGAIGTVVSCSLSPPDASGTRTAVVEFNDPALAQAALYLNDTPLGDKSLAIRLADSADSHSSHEPSGNIEAFNPFANMLRSAAQAPVLPMGGVFGGSIDISNALSEAARKRADEVARTIYVGNLDGAITEEHLKMVFQVAGEILYIKIAGDVNNPQSGRYGFIEFSKLESVPVAMQLSGTVLANRPLKVGHANNPIVKTSAVHVAGPDPIKLSDAMKLVMIAKEAIVRRKTPIIEEEARRRAEREERDRQREIERVEREKERAEREKAREAERIEREKAREAERIEREKERQAETERRDRERKARHEAAAAAAAAGGDSSRTSRSRERERERERDDRRPRDRDSERDRRKRREEFSDDEDEHVKKPSSSSSSSSSSRRRSRSPDNFSRRSRSPTRSSK